MKQNARPFLSVGDRNLYMDLVLAEFRDPILFTCLDEAESMYLAVCYRADAQERCGLVAETTPKAVMDLLRSRVTIRDAFPQRDEVLYWAVQTQGAETPAVRRCRAEEVPEEFFPTPEMFMDGDEEEFREELAVLARRA